MTVRSKQAPKTLSTLQLNRALMARQFLLKRVNGTVEQVLEHLVGMQAQVPASPYVGLWSRLQKFDPAELSDLLVHRSAVRAVLMRSTLHLVTAGDFVAIWPLTRAVAQRQFKASEFARDLVGLEPEDVAAVADSILRASPQTQAALAKSLSPSWPERRPESLAYAIRSVLPLVQIPPRGLWGKSGQATWARAEDWLSRPVSRRPSLKSLFERYLAAFGPATISDFQSWSGLAGVRQQLEGLRPQLETYRDEHGRELFDLPGSMLPEAKLSVPVRFLPEYDNVLLAHSDRSRVIPESFRKRISIGQPTVLVDGFVRGTWKLNRKGASAALVVSLFEPLSKRHSTELRREATQLLGFLEADALKSKIEITINE